MHWNLLLALVASAQAYSVQWPFSSTSRVVQVDQPAKSFGFPTPRLPKPPVIIDLSSETIAEILNKSLHEGHPTNPPRFPPPGPPHVLPLHRLAWLLNISTADDLKAQLADEKANLTLIAPDDEALRPRPGGGRGEDHRHGPPHRGPRHDHDEPKSPRDNPLLSHHVIRALTEDDSQPSALKDSDEEEKKKKEFLKKLVGYILKYHLLEKAYHPHELADASTVGTSLDDTRIHVEPRFFPTPSLVFNFYSKTVDVVVKAKNGYIYLVNAPVFPPLPPLAELFILPGIFSTLTSGVQKSGLDLRTFHCDDSNADDAVHPAVWSTLQELVKELPPAQTFTVFAPTNGAFKRLGWELNAFLFSPFTNKLLKAILSYHVVPDVVFYSDFNVNATVTSVEAGALPRECHHHHAPEELVEAGLAHEKPHGWFKRRFAPGPGEVKITHYSLKTLFNDTSLPVDVYEYRKGLFGKGPLERAIWVGTGEGNKPGSRVKVVAKDVPAFKGAVQVVTSLLRPPFPERRHDHDHEGEDDHSDFHRAAHQWR